MRPLKLSQKPFCIGLPGAMKCQAIWLPAPRRAWRCEVNSVPLSETIMPGLPRRLINPRQLARHPPSRIEVSGIAARHSRVTSSTMLRMRKRRRWRTGHGRNPATSGHSAGLDQDRRPRPRRVAEPLRLRTVRPSSR